MFVASIFLTTPFPFSKNTLFSFSIRWPSQLSSEQTIPLFSSNFKSNSFFKNPFPQPFSFALQYF